MSDATTIRIKRTDKARFEEFFHNSRSKSYIEAFGKLMDVAEEQQAEGSS